MDEVPANLKYNFEGKKEAFSEFESFNKTEKRTSKHDI